MFSELSSRQQRFLDYLQREITAQGRAPSLRQAAQALGVSHTAIAQSLKLLEEKGHIKRHGRYSRTIHLLSPAGKPSSVHRWREIPIIGKVTAGLPMYAQQEWDGHVVLDANIFPGQNLFALHIIGDSMKDAGILEGDLAVCEPRQYAKNNEIVVALVHSEEATVKRFFLHQDHIELRPENPRYKSLHYGFSDILIQGKVIGVQRGPEGIK